MERDTKGQFVFLVPSKAANLLEELPNLDGRNPYRGLRTFEIEDGYAYFGRSKAVSELLNKFFNGSKNNQVTMVTGASGIGKSSLVLAGMIPSLKRTDPSLKIFGPLRPGNLHSNPNYLREQAASINSVKTSFLLFVDQFEETITLCSQNEKREWMIFLDKQMQNRLCKIVITLRNDFELQVREMSGGELLFTNRFVVPLFDRLEIRDIIVQPALQADIHIEAASGREQDTERFIDQICDEAVQSIGSLPLLSFALEQWYETNLSNTGNKNILYEINYHCIGGLAGALGIIINKFIESNYDAIESENLKALLIRLVTTHDGNFARVKCSTMNWTQATTTMEKEHKEKF